MAANWDPLLSPAQPVGAHTHSLDASAALDLSALAPAGATRALVQPIGAALVYTLDGSTPTLAHGFRLADGADPLELPLSGGITLRVLQVAALTLQVQYFK